MSDLFAGTQSYRDLRSRLLRIIPSLMTAGLASSLRFPGKPVESVQNHS